MTRYKFLLINNAYDIFFLLLGILVSMDKWMDEMDEWMGWMKKWMDGQLLGVCFHMASFKWKYFNFI